MERRSSPPRRFEWIHSSGCLCRASSWIMTTEMLLLLCLLWPREDYPVYSWTKSPVYTTGDWSIPWLLFYYRAGRRGIEACLRDPIVLICTPILFLSAGFLREAFRFILWLFIANTRIYSPPERRPIIHHVWHVVKPCALPLDRSEDHTRL